MDQFSSKAWERKIFKLTLDQWSIDFELMPCPFTGPKMVCASPAKNLTTFSASSKTFVPAQKTILLNANHLFV